MQRIPQVLALGCDDPFTNRCKEWHRDHQESEFARLR